MTDDKEYYLIEKGPSEDRMTAFAVFEDLDYAKLFCEKYEATEQDKKDKVVSVRIRGVVFIEGKLNTEDI